MRKHFRIKNYIMVTESLVLVLSIVLMAVLFMVFYRYTLLRDIKSEVNRRSSDIIGVLESDGLTAATSDQETVFKISEAASSQDGRVIVVDRTYKILTDTDSQAEGAFIINKNVMDIMKGASKEIRYDTYMDTVRIAPITSNGEVIGAIIYRASLASSYKNMGIMSYFLIAVMIVLIGIDLIMTRLISNRSVRDINDINEKIMHAALGNLQERLPEDEGFVEIQVLAENYNEVLERLATIDQTRTEFVSNVSHELKTPITSMKVLAESLTQNEAATREDYAEFMSDIVDEIDRETKIINDLLTLVKTDSNSNDMNLEETDINEMMETIVKTVSPLAKQRGISLSYENYKEITARVDAVKLSLAISNLIENAVKYNVDNGWIKCSLNTDNRYFYIKVADSGVGIPDDAKDRVFDRFYRVDKARSRDTGGTGLGLSITRGIVNAHKGTIKLYSESGKGTTFTVKIPLDNK